MNKLQDDIITLFSKQADAWETVRRNYDALQSIRKTTVEFRDFRIDVQYNPDRVRSTTAPEGENVKRPCFLCRENRPAEQLTVPWQDYDILVNPYPIFSPHFTIAAGENVPQLLTGRLRDMAALAQELPDFAITFNGARSGASAPDHFHFQAVQRTHLPAGVEIRSWESRTEIYRNESTSVWAAEDYLRPAVVIEGSQAAETAGVAETVMGCLKEVSGDPDEAQVNALAWIQAERFFIVLFPRTAHRPREFYAEGKEQFLFSPGAIDMAGVMITVREADFDRLTAPLITELYTQVVPTGDRWEQIKITMGSCLQNNRK